MSIKHEIESHEKLKARIYEIDEKTKKTNENQEAFQALIKELNVKYTKGEITGEEYRDLCRKWHDEHDG